MAALVGFVQESWNTAGQATLAWPAGTAANHLAVAEASHSDARQPLPDGWTYAGDAIYWRMLTAADITAGSVLVKGSLTSLTILSGAAGIGRTSEQAQVKVRSASGGMLVRGWTDRYDTGSIAPSTYRLGTQTTSPEDQHQHAMYFRAASAAGYLSLPSASDDAGFRAYEVLAPAAPLTPVLLGPDAGSAVDRNAPVVLSFAHQSASGLPQVSVTAQIRVANGTWGSVKGDGTIAAGDTGQVITTDAGQVTVAAGVLTVGSQYEWRVITRDAAGTSPTSASSTIVARVLPTATCTLTTAFGDRSPTVAISATASTGTIQAVQVLVCPAADGTPEAPLWDSGILSGAVTSLEVPAVTGWTNGAQYRAWVRATDSALTGAWSSSTAQPVAWTPPAAPVGITAADGSPPTITASGVPAGSTAVEVQSASAAVEDWADLATTPNPGTTVVVSVPLAPYNVPRRYRARAWALVDGVPQPSAWITSTAMTSTDLDAYIVSADRSSWVRVYIVEAGALVPIQQSSRTTGIGDTFQRIDRTPVAGWQSWWDVETDLASEADTLMGWLTDPDRPAMWLRPTPERSYGAGPVDGPPWLVAVDVPGADRVVQTNLAARRIKWLWVTQDDEED